MDRHIIAVLNTVSRMTLEEVAKTRDLLNQRVDEIHKSQLRGHQDQLDVINRHLGRM